MKISRCELAAHPPTRWVSSLLFDMKRWPSDAVSVPLMQNGVERGTIQRFNPSPSEGMPAGAAFYNPRLINKETFVTKILWIIILLGLTGVRQALAVDVRDTRMLSQPAISKTHIAFIYAGDLWVADHD